MFVANTTTENILVNKKQESGVKVPPHPLWHDARIISATNVSFLKKKKMKKKKKLF